MIKTAKPLRLSVFPFGILGVVRARWGKDAAALAMLVLFTVGSPTPSRAQAMGDVSVVFAKAGRIVGAGRGRGVLTYRGHDYPFRVSGLSLGITVGASAVRLTGTCFRLARSEDFRRY